MIPHTRVTKSGNRPGSGPSEPAAPAAPGAAAVRSRFADLVARYPVATFLLIALPLSLGLMTLPVLAQYDLIPGKGLAGKIGLDMEEAASILLVISIFLAALAVTAMEGGKEGVRVLVRRMTRWQAPARWWLVATLAIPAGTVTLALLLGDTAAVPSLSALGDEAVALLIALVLINLWEEAVWVGFMQTRIERKHALFTAAAVTAVPFAAVHMPLRLITGEAKTAVELLTSFVVLLVFMLVVRSLFGDILDGPNRQNAALLTTVLLTVVLAVVARRRLARSYRAVLDEREKHAPVTTA
jgi:membrane protease YdiL (CAAX protease family)